MESKSTNFEKTTTSLLISIKQVPGLPLGNIQELKDQKLCQPPSSFFTPSAILFISFRYHPGVAKPKYTTNIPTVMQILL
jgi:hypothetical protein